MNTENYMVNKLSSNDLQGLIWLSAGSMVSKKVPSTLYGVFKLEYSSIVIHSNTEVSEYKMPLGLSYNNFLYTNPLTISINSATITNNITNNNFGTNKTTGKVTNNYGLVVLQGLCSLQNLFPIIFNSPRYSGPVVITSFTEITSGITCTYNIELRQITPVVVTSELGFNGTVTKA
ncbi:hypothetical protein ACFX5K_00110 [Rickettsiales bacterium LUAb2]